MARVTITVAITIAVAIAIAIAIAVAVAITTKLAGAGVARVRPSTANRGAGFGATKDPIALPLTVNFAAVGAEILAASSALIAVRGGWRRASLSNGGPFNDSAVASVLSLQRVRAFTCTGEEEVLRLGAAGDGEHS